MRIFVCPLIRSVELKAVTASLSVATLPMFVCSHRSLAPGREPITHRRGRPRTVFAPITAALAGSLGWRHTYLILAVTLLLVAVPLHWFALRGAWVTAPAAHGHIVRARHIASPGNDVAQIARSKPVSPAAPRP